MEELAIEINVWVSEPVQEAEIDEQINEGVLVSDGFAIAKNGTLNAEGFGLGIDTLDGGALVVYTFVKIAVAVESVAEACTDRGRHHGRAATGLPELVMSRASIRSSLRMKQWTDIFAALVFNEARGAIGEGKLERHGQARLANGKSIGRKGSARDGLTAFL